MQKVALNFICKDESHVILKMLRSAQPIVDLIVAVDTGSTDNTRAIIEQFGQEHQIPTYVFERPFDDFSGSRNFALEKLRSVAADLGWNAHKTFVLWMDCDEKLVIHPSFKKNKLNKDIHSVPGAIDNLPYTRDEFFKLSKNFFWYGPIHEKLSINEPVVFVSVPGIEMVSEKTGSSWKGHLGEKNKRYGDILEDFIEHQDRGERWVFMTAQSYATAGFYYEDGEEKVKLLRKAIRYYDEVAGMVGADIESRYFAQLQVGSIMELLGDNWLEVQAAFFRAYMTDPIRGEAIKYIIQHYIKQKNWPQAYIYTNFAKSTFLNHNPSHLRSRFVDQIFYNWEVLELHREVCRNSNREKESEDTYKELIKITQRKPEYFNKADMERIRSSKEVLPLINC